MRVHGPEGSPQLPPPRGSTWGYLCWVLPCLTTWGRTNGYYCCKPIPLGGRCIVTDFSVSLLLPPWHLQPSLLGFSEAVSHLVGQPPDWWDLRHESPHLTQHLTTSFTIHLQKWFQTAMTSLIKHLKPPQKIEPAAPSNTQKRKWKNAMSLRSGPAGVG